MTYLQRLKTIFATDLLSGFATALFSIPEGMAYAQLAGVNPVFGIYSGIVATIVSSLTASTTLMISTLTSAIAISTHSVLQIAHIPSSQTTSALFTITFLVGVTMFLLGILKLGRLVDYISNAVITGFVIAVSWLIIVGELGHLVGYPVRGANHFQKVVDWLSHIHDWQLSTTCVGVATILFMLILQKIPRIKQAASIVVLLIGTLLVAVLGLSDVVLVGDVAHIPSSLPMPMLPDFSLIPSLSVGAMSIAIVALAQAASISAAIPNPDRHTSSLSRDFLGMGLGNMAASGFQSMATGGSLSRTGISVGAGAQTRWGGVFAGLWLSSIVLLMGHYAEKVPLAVIAGMLCVIGSRLIIARIDDVKLIVRSSSESMYAMLFTFILAMFIPLQWTIFLGAGLSFLLYIRCSATNIQLLEVKLNKEGQFEEHPLPKTLTSHAVTVLSFRGNNFFAEIPAVKRLIPSYKNTHHAVVIWRMRGYEDVHSTFLKWIKNFALALHKQKNELILEGTEPHVMQQLKKSGILDLIGEHNVFAATPVIGESLHQALAHGDSYLSR